MSQLFMETDHPAPPPTPPQPSQPLQFQDYASPMGPSTGDPAFQPPLAAPPPLSHVPTESILVSMFGGIVATWDRWWTRAITIFEYLQTYQYWPTLAILCAIIAIVLYSFVPPLRTRPREEKYKQW